MVRVGRDHRGSVGGSGDRVDRTLSDGDARDDCSKVGAVTRGGFPLQARSKQSVRKVHAYERAPDDRLDRDVAPRIIPEIVSE